jgi:hypothetical protein
LLVGLFMGDLRHTLAFRGVSAVLLIRGNAELGGGSWGQALRVFHVLTGAIEYFLQHVVVLAELHELPQNDLAEPLSSRRQTTKAVMHGGD